MFLAPIPQQRSIILFPHHHLLLLLFSILFSNLIQKYNRTECRACETIIDDFEVMKNILKQEDRYGNNEINEQLLESLCNSLGFNHQPYGWLENTCDIMIEEYYDDILEIVTLRDKLHHSKIKLKETLSSKICSKIFNCKSDSKEL